MSKLQNDDNIPAGGLGAYLPRPPTANVTHFNLGRSFSMRSLAILAALSIRYFLRDCACRASQQSYPPSA